MKIRSLDLLESMKSTLIQSTQKLFERANPNTRHHDPYTIKLHSRLQQPGVLRLPTIETPMQHPQLISYWYKAGVYWVQAASFSSFINNSFDNPIIESAVPSLLPRNGKIKGSSIMNPPAQCITSFLLNNSLMISGGNGRKCWVAKSVP